MDIAFCLTEPGLFERNFLLIIRIWIHQILLNEDVMIILSFAHVIFYTHDWLK